MLSEQVLTFPPEPPMEMDDAMLMSAVAAGDRAALATLYDRHHLSVLAVLQRIVRDSALAEDLLHDVFLEAWHQAAAYDSSRGTVRTWLLIRARSRGLDRRNKVLRDTELVTRAQEEGSATTLAQPTQPMELDGARVRYLTTRLSHDLQEVIELAYFEDLSSTQIADHLRIPVGTVKSRMARALGSLRSAFELELEMST